MKLSNKIKLLAVVIIALLFTSCLTTTLEEFGFIETDPDSLPKVYTFKDYIDTTVSYTKSVKASLMNQNKCFLPSDINTSEFPTDFSVPVLYPESEKEGNDYSELNGTRIDIISFCVNTKGEVVELVAACDKYGFLNTLQDKRRSPKVISVLKDVITKSHTEDNSEIITIVVSEEFYEAKDLGVIETNKKEDFPEGYQKSKLHGICLGWKLKILDTYTTVQNFENNDAVSIFKYGKIEIITVKSPVGDFSVNKPELTIGLSKKRTIQLYYTTENIDEKKLMLEFNPEKSTSLEGIFMDILNGVGLLNVGKKYILTIEIVKDYGEYFLSESGWKIYPQSTQMKNYLQNFVGKTLYGYLEKICMEVRVIQTGNEYELVLQPQQFELFY